MDHEILVRVVDGAAQHLKQLQTLLERTVMVLAEQVDWLPFHEVHDDVGEPFVRGAPVDQAGDVRMIQRGEDLALATKAIE